MFLRFVNNHNPGLIDYGMYALERGCIEPDTYVLDLDAIENNARRLQEFSVSHGITLYFMAKQLGRNPEAARRVLAAGQIPGQCENGSAKRFGFTGMVAVDFREARVLYSAGLSVKHLGHLCQVPCAGWDAALDMNPEVITLYSSEKARELSRAAEKRGLIVNALLRVWDKGDIFYPGQEGGFSLAALPQALDALGKLPGIRIAGVTSFPCFLYREETGRPEATPNARTVIRGAASLREQGIVVSQINMPSCNSPATMPIAVEMGATHLEPGHSLTGTNPDNLNEALPLIPALVYMTEVSHRYESFSYCYGGGFYRRSHLRYALVKTASGSMETTVTPPDPEAIDYHFRLAGAFPSGAPVCMAFRTQIFVTRSRLALVEGLSRSQPILHSVWDSSGNMVSRGRV